MDKSLKLLILLSGVLMSFLLVKTPPKPLYFSMDGEAEIATDRKLLGQFSNSDTMLEHDFFLLSDEQQHPLLFFSDVLTPVCIDAICKPVRIQLYWNLVGTYVGFGLLPDQPLTKFDHDEFLEEDYAKLNQLLSDNKSVFRRRTLEELFDKDAKPEKKITYRGVEVDAVTGATKAEIKNSVVEGALYSCYAIWHLVHGQIQDRAMTYLDSMYNKEIEQYFLYSIYPDYHLYALRKMDKFAFIDHLPQLATIFKSANPLLRTYLLKKMPKELWHEKDFIHQLYNSFPDVDVMSKTMLLGNLPLAQYSNAEILSNQVSEMSRNQLKTYLEYLLLDPTLITDEMIKQLNNAVSDSYTYSYLITEFLDRFK